MSILKERRRQAGVAYANAAKQFVDAWVELQAHDLAASNSRSGYSEQVRGFAAQPLPPAHGEFLTTSIHGDAADRARALHEQLLRGL